MDFIDNIVSNRLGGNNFFNESRVFKFEKLKMIRDDLKAKGIELLDTPQGVRWKKID